MTRNPKEPEMTKANVDLDAIFDAGRRMVPGTRCTAGDTLKEMDPALRAKTEAAFDDKAGFSIRGLVETMQHLANAYDRPSWAIGRAVVERHRNKECRCTK